MIESYHQRQHLEKMTSWVLAKDEFFLTSLDQLFCHSTSASYGLIKSLVTPWTVPVGALLVQA